MPAIIELDAISKRYPGVLALDAVSFDVEAGELHAIVGENGAGKSTLMKILAGVIADYEGAYRLRGGPVRFAGTAEAERAGVAIIHQELNLVDDLSVAANIFLGRELRNRWRLLDEAAMRAAARRMLAELECDVPPGTRVRTLRVGDRQLIEIAKALSQEASILIMDEPTSALSESEVERLFRVIERLLARGVTILYISHKMNEVFRRSDRVTVLRDGRHVRTLRRIETNPGEVTRLMVGREIQNLELAQGRAAGETLLEVRDLTLPWPGHAQRNRLEGVSFSLRRGEVLGVAGLMGAGRTELLECLFGSSAVPPTGSLRLDGVERTFPSPHEAMRAGLALVTEDRKRLGLFPQMNVRENVTICALRQDRRGGFVSSKAETRAARESIGALGIKTAGTESPITALSGGNQQKAIIARWLRTNPQVLLLDDPTRGVDVGAKAEIYRLIDGLCRDGLGIIVTSSELPELMGLCDRIVVLCEGRVTATLDRTDFSEEAIMLAATQRNRITVAGSG